jgi:hypothetical protein
MNTIKLVYTTLIIFFSQFAMAQDTIQILVLGTSHYNLEKDSAEQNQVIQKLKSFNPDMIMGEFVSPQDYLRLDPESYRRKMNDSTLLYYGKLNADLQFQNKKITKGIQQLSKSPYLHKLRIELAARLLNGYDLANAQYQIYTLEKHCRQFFNTDELEYYKRRLISTDSLLKKGLYNKTSEYHTILFPLMYDLKIPMICAIDCQTYDLPWTQSWRIVAYCMHFINRIAKMDPASEEAKIIAKIQEEKDHIYAASDSLGLRGYAYLNSIYNAEESDLINFYGGEKLFGFSINYPEKEVKEMIKYWRLRNAGMAQNVLRQAEEQKAQRIVVAAGSAHQKWIENELKQQTNVKIIHYNDL